MNKLVPFKKFSKKVGKIVALDDTSVIVDKKGVPLGFVFGRDSFISFLQHIDDEFERKVKDPKIAFNNPAGRLIDLIEEKLPVRPKFIKEVRKARIDAKKMGWVSLEDIERSLNV